MDTFTIQQNLFMARHPLISVTNCPEEVLTPQQLGNFLQTVTVGGQVGLAPVYDAKCRLTKLAMATASQVLLITLSPKSSKKSEKTLVRLALENMFSNPGVTAYAFKMDYVAAALFLNHGIHLAAGKHLLSVSSRKQLDGLLAALGERRGVPLVKNNIIDLFRNEESSTNEPKTTALQAWAAYQAATMPQTCEPVVKLPVINTLVMDITVCISFYLQLRG
jgi:hypothetical protein